MSGRDCRHWFAETAHSVRAVVRRRHDERLGRIDDVALQSSRDAAHGCIREWSLAFENARAWDRPVAALGRCAPALLYARRLLEVRRPIGRAECRERGGQTGWNPGAD